jgi:3-deoxy-D-manno-octulosonate 8-phosphate phosphatase (KDO 8-P phosphatase)
MINKFATENTVTLDEIAYIGDDINDLECIRACGVSGCPADAADDVKKYADFVSAKRAGSGAVRDFSEYIIRRNS